MNNTINITSPINLTAATCHSRYAINGVYVTANGVAAATNGHILTAVTGLQVEGTFEPTIVPSELFTKTKYGSTIDIDGINCKVSKNDKNGIATNTNKTGQTVEGTFPPFSNVIPDYNDKAMRVSINAQYLVDMAKAMADDSSEHANERVTLSITSPDKPILVHGNNENAIGVLMPVTLDMDHKAQYDNVVSRLK
jgi:DNA polymerase III sliding clamp (beta) subunit (PCNA family)